MSSVPSSLVSVIVPIYNAECFLDQCLSSIRAQSHRELEVICINDGSTDGSLAIMERHAVNDSRIRIINKENGGYGAGCNCGLREARGEWISIIEPDDWIEPDMYRDMLAFAQTWHNLDVVKTPWWDVKYWDEPARMKAYPCLLTGRIARSRHPMTLSECPELIAWHPGIWSALYRKSFLNTKGIRFPEYPGAGWADNPFLIDTLAQAQGIVYLDAPYYRYRADLPGSTRNHPTADAVVRPFERWLTMLDHLEALGCTDRGVLDALYARGFTYADGAMFDDGAGNPLVVDGMKRMFARMDESLVLDSPRLSARRKRLFCSLRSLPNHVPFRVARVRFVFQDALCYLRVYGLGELFARVSDRLTGRRE